MRPFLSILIPLFLLGGCISQQKCNRLYPPVKETKEYHYTKEIRKDSLLPGATVYDTLYKDSISFYPAYKTITVQDKAGLAELTWYKDAYGNLVAKCTANERMVEGIKQVIRDQINSQETKVITKVPWWMFVIIGFMAAVIVFFIIIFKIK